MDRFKNKLYGFTYNFNCAAPDLTLKDSVTLPASGCHDLFAGYGKDSLWLSTSSKIWAINLANKNSNGTKRPGAGEKCFLRAQ